MALLNLTRNHTNHTDAQLRRSWSI